MSMMDAFADIFNPPKTWGFGRRVAVPVDKPVVVRAKPDKKLKALEQENGRLVAMLAELQRKNDELTGERERLKSALEGSEAEIAKFKSLRLPQINELDRTYEHIKVQGRRIDELLGANATLERALAQQTGRLESMRRRNAGLRKKLKALKS